MKPKNERAEQEMVGGVPNHYDLERISPAPNFVTDSSTGAGGGHVIKLVATLKAQVFGKKVFSFKKD